MPRISWDAMDADAAEQWRQVTQAPPPVDEALLDPEDPTEDNPDATSAGGPSGPEGSNSSPFKGISPYQREWQPRLVYEAAPEAPFSGSWRAEVPTPVLRQLHRRDTGEAFEKVTPRMVLGVFDTEKAAGEFAALTWRDAHKSVVATDPGPRITRVLQWSGPPSPEANAWMAVAQTAHQERTDVVIQYRDSTLAAHLPTPSRVVEVDPFEAVRSQWPQDPRNLHDESPDVTEESPLTWRTEELRGLMVQRDPMRGGVFLWQGVEIREPGLKDAPLWSKTRPVAAVPMLFDSVRAATDHARQLGFSTVTLVSDDVKYRDDQLVHRSPDQYRQAKIPKAKWPTAVQAQDVFERTADLTTRYGLGARWERPAHGWQTAPMDPRPDAPWVAWRQTMEVGRLGVEFARDSHAPNRIREYVSREAVLADYPDAAQHPVPSSMVKGYLQHGGFAGDSLPTGSTVPAPLLNYRQTPVYVSGKRQWVTSVVEYDATGPTRGTTFVGDQEHAWAGMDGPVGEQHQKLVETFRALQKWPPPPTQSPKTDTPKAPVPEASPATSPTRQEPEIPKDRMVIAAVAEDRYAVYMEPAFRHGAKTWVLEKDPPITEVLAPDPRVPASACLPKAGRIGDKTWIALPRDFKPQQQLLVYRRAEDAADAVRRLGVESIHSEPGLDPRTPVQVRDELRHAPFPTVPFKAHEATAYVATLDAQHQAAWVDVPWSGQRGWLLTSPESGKPQTLLTRSSAEAMRQSLTDMGITKVQIDPRPPMDVYRELFHENPGLRPGALDSAAVVLHV